MNITNEVVSSMNQNHNQKILVIIPTYNEAENISILLKRLFSLQLSLSVLIIDDGSPDGTYDKVRRLQDNYPDLYLIRREKKSGLGSAYRLGYRYAVEKNYTVLVQMDADLSHDPFCIPAMVNLLSEYDMVIGSRYVQGGGVLKWPWHRVLSSRLSNIFIRSLLGIPVHDLTSGFKCFKKDVLENIDFSATSSKGYAFQIEITFLTFLKGFKMVEYPILFQERVRGESKMSLAIAIEAFMRVLFLWKKKVLKIVH